MEKNTIKIKDIEYPIYETEIEYDKLKFYKDNPRIYSVINSSETEPSQQQIEEEMCKLDHVRDLKASIVEFGGLAEPIYVRDKSFDVLEGNSRLAAYRLLNKQFPCGKWKNIRCYILPSDIPESAIRALLGTLHLVGRTDWNPFEQAGYLYRIKNKENIDEKQLAKELGLSSSDVKNSIQVFTLMKEMDDVVPEHWSYYAEYCKSQFINKKRKDYSNLDKAFSDQVKGNRIKEARDVRNYFAKALQVQDKVTNKAIEKFISGKYDIYDVMDEIQSTGKIDDSYKLLNSFRKKICDETIADEMAKNKDSQIDFELSKILKQLTRIIKKREK